MEKFWYFHRSKEIFIDLKTKKMYLECALYTEIIKLKSNHCVDTFSNILALICYSNQLKFLNNIWALALDVTTG